MVWQLNEALSEQIREEAEELLAEMETALLELEDCPDDKGLVNRVFRAMHTVKGAANMFGIEPVAELTHEVETVFDLVRNGKLPVSPQLLDVSFLARDLIRNLVTAPETVDPEVTASVKRFLRALAAGETLAADLLPGRRGVASSEQDEAGDEDPAVCAPEEEFLEELQEEAPQTVAPEPEQEASEPEAEQRVYALRFRPLGSRMLVHADPLGILDELGQMGECTILPHSEDVPGLEALEPEACALWWELLLRSSAGENALRDVFIFVEDQSELEITLVEDPEQWLRERSALLLPLAPESEPQPMGVAEPAPVPDPVPVPAPAPEPVQPRVAAAPPPPAASREVPRPAAAADRPKPPACAKSPAASPAGGGGREPERKDTPPTRAKKESASSIRVDAHKLDDMVALVGELVIAQARLTQIAAGSGDPTLQSVAEEIELLSGSLRDRTLSMRMLPIGTTFDRFRRLVRDLSHELGKDIELVTQGAETELDKTVIEQLGDPLVHLLRNSIDHGLETPEERRAAGKSPRGTIVLSAEHSGGHVLIRIFDDGRGLDRDRIAAKGVERGLINDAAGLSDKEIFGLIFLPGFSTAAQVSNVSGRGVGMDVVKRSIDALRGNVDIESGRGVGTTVTVKLPLTLAIIEGLQVRVGGEFFVIPLAAVQECVELTRDDRNGEAGSHKRIINLRNEIVPYIRLREWFAIAGEQPEIEQIIIVGDDSGVTGIVVDEVVGQQQTVIKSLGTVFSQVEELSGATIKPDGSMALILDVHQLVRRVLQARAVAEE